MAITDPRDIAAAAPIRTAAALANTGTGKYQCRQRNARHQRTANLPQTVTLTYDIPSDTFDVAGTGDRQPANVAYTAGWQH